MREAWVQAFPCHWHTPILGSDAFDESISYIEQSALAASTNRSVCSDCAIWEGKTASFGNLDRLALAYRVLAVGDNRFDALEAARYVHARAVVVTELKLLSMSLPVPDDHHGGLASAGQKRRRRQQQSVRIVGDGDRNRTVH